MGIFGGSFGTGLAKGLAEGTTKALQDAMDKREEELSTAQKYMMIRQQQKQEKADAEDTRIKENLNRFIDEFNGDVARGLAAYKAAGGSADRAEAFFAEVDETRSSGLDYNLMDKFKADNIDFSQYGNLTPEKAFASVRTEITPISVQMQDTGLLSKVGLGRKDMGADVSDAVNARIPSVEREGIEGLVGGVLDRSGTISSIRAKNELEDALGDVSKRYDIVTTKIATGKDAFGRDLPKNQMAELRLQQADLITAMGAKETALNASTSTGASLTEISSLYKTRLANDPSLKTYSKNDQTGVITMLVNGEIVEGKDADAAYDAAFAAMQDNFIRDGILDEDGDFVSTEAEYTAKALGMGDAIAKVRQSIISTNNNTVVQQDDSSVIDEQEIQKWSDTSSVLADPTGYVDWMTTSAPDITTTIEGITDLENALLQSGVSRADVDSLLMPYVSALQE